MVKITNSRKNANSKRARSAIAAHKTAVGGDVAAYIKANTPPRLPFPSKVANRSTDDDRLFYEENKARFDAGNLAFKKNNPNWWDQNGRRVFAAGSLQDLARQKRESRFGFLNEPSNVIVENQSATKNNITPTPETALPTAQPRFAKRPWQKLGVIKKGGLFGNKTIGYRSFSPFNGNNGFISNIDRFNGLRNGNITSPIAGLVQERAQEIQDFIAKSRR